MKFDIEAYLNGELDGEALEQFEAALAGDPALREEVELLRPTWHDLRRAAIARRVEAAAQRRAARRRAQRIVVLSCSVLLGLGGIWWWQREQKTPNLPPVNRSSEPPSDDDRGKAPVQNNSPAENTTPPVAQKQTPPSGAGKNAFLALAERRYQAPAEFSSLRGDVPADQLAAEKRAFADKKYDDVWRLLEKNTAGALPEARYLKAHTLFRQRAFSQSATAFDALAADPDASLWKDACEWYALLATVAQGEKATRRLKNITADADHPFRKEAGALFTDLQQVQ